MITPLIVTHSEPKKQSPKRPIVHTSQAIVCSACGKTFEFGNYEYAHIEARYNDGCTCGGRYEFRSIRELYERDGVHFCARLQRYWRTVECPTPTCWADRCVIGAGRIEEASNA